MMKNILLPSRMAFILGILCLPNDLIASLATDSWQMDGYVGWEHIEMDGEVVIVFAGPRENSYKELQRYFELKRELFS